MNSHGRDGLWLPERFAAPREASLHAVFDGVRLLWFFEARFESLTFGSAASEPVFYFSEFPLALTGLRVGCGCSHPDDYAELTQEYLTGYIFGHSPVRDSRFEIVDVHPGLRWVRLTWTGTFDPRIEDGLMDDVPVRLVVTADFEGIRLSDAGDVDRVREAFDCEGLELRLTDDGLVLGPPHEP